MADDATFRIEQWDAGDQCVERLIAASDNFAVAHAAFEAAAKEYPHARLKLYKQERVIVSRSPESYFWNASGFGPPGCPELPRTFLQRVWQSMSPSVKAASLIYVGVVVGAGATYYLASVHPEILGIRPERVIVQPKVDVGPARPPIVLGQEIRVIYPAEIDRAMVECVDGLRSALVERAGRRDIDPKTLRIEVLPRGDLTYIINLWGPGVLLSTHSTDFREDLSFFVHVGRNYKDVNELTVTFYLFRSRKNMGPLSKPVNEGLWNEMSREDESGLTDLQSFISSRFRNCIISQGM
jgi:hypothetical protein